MAPRGGGGRRGGGGGPLPREVQVSKKLSWLLRHGASDEGLTLGPDGYVSLAAVLANRKIRGLGVSVAEVRRIVADNDKQRFSLIPARDARGPASGEEGGEAGGVGAEGTTGVELAGGVRGEEAGEGQAPLGPALDDPSAWLIRANQGHSLKLASDEGLLTAVTAANAPATVVHGTTRAAWRLIVSSGGLRPMARNHVHFAAGLPAGFRSAAEAETDGSKRDAEEGGGGTTVAAPTVVSGMRTSSTVLMFLDLPRAMEAGLGFGLSANGVVLTAGDGDGLVPLRLFKRVEDRMGQGVLLEDGEIVKEAVKGRGAKGEAAG